MPDNHQSSNPETRVFRPKPRVARRPMGASQDSAAVGGVTSPVPHKRTNQVDRYARSGVSHSARPPMPAHANRPQGSPSGSDNVRRSSRPAPRRANQVGDAKPAPLTRKSFGDNNRRPPSNRYAAVESIQLSTAAKVKPVVMASGSRKLRVIPLGGAGEVGSKNMTAFEYGQDIIVVDCGIGFPTAEQPGVDAVVPDVTYLEERRNNIRGMLVTHGHEDHIGAVPYIWPRLRMPIYTAPLTAGLIQAKLEEAGLKEVKINIINSGDKLQFGALSVEVVRLTHSIPDALGLAIRCPAGLFFYAVDWRLEHSPVLGQPADWARIAQLSAEGITALFSDSTNAERPGYSPTERVIEETYNAIFQKTKGRIVMAQFASQVNRIQQVINVAKRFGRRIALSGRSMERYVNIAMQLGYLSVPDGLLIDLRKVNTLPPDKVVILATGSQGEEYSALTRMSEGEHRQIKLDRNDTVVVSASVIPGNEKPVGDVIDNLFRMGVNVIQSKEMDIHVTGHPSQEELKLMLGLCRPQYFIPIHGDYRHLVAHASIAKQLGIPDDHIFLIENGQVLEFDDKGGRIAQEKVQTGDIMIDGLGIGDVGPVVINDRLTLAAEGIVAIFLVANKKTGALAASPDIVSRGFIYLKENEGLIAKIRDIIRQSYAKGQTKFGTDYEQLKQFVRDDVSNYIYQQTQRNPMIIPVVATI